jgi:UDP-N-acetylmuramoyl-L-alanyl-D-glutamate--2,6-diaminopimelate ligase
MTVRLDELLATLGARPGLSGLIVDDRHVDPASVEVESMTHDSTEVEPGALFCCVPGRQTDGHDFAPAAVEAGAVALLAERRLDLPVPQLLVSSVRAAMGLVASAFHGDPSQRIPVVGVTGTNGKTTVCHLVASIFEASGRPSGVIGTLSGTRTTPEATELQARLATFARAGAAVAMEVSSHALVQHRVDGTRFAIAAFTNLSQDHLDYHRTMEAYFDAKAMLFEPGRADRAVVCLDDPHGRLLRDAAQIPTVGYGSGDASAVSVSTAGTSFTWRGVRMSTRLVGRFNLLNAIAAATITAELGVETEIIAKGLEAASPVPGRFELVDAGQPFLVVVDYAHTPDGITQALATARELAGEGSDDGGRVHIVFGCGGDRDPSKRPRMGAAAAEGADEVIVTSDNPRFEHPDAIIEEVVSGFPHDDIPRVEPDRRRAIAAALESAAPGDVVVIAGKGHETTQVIGEREEPFDDRQVVREEWAARGQGAAPGG